MILGHCDLWAHTCPGAGILDYGRQNLDEMDELKIGVIFELFI